MLRLLIACDRGFEAECIDEVKNLINDEQAASQRFEGFITIDVKSREDALHVSYMAQTPIKVFAHLATFDDTSEEKYQDYAQSVASDPRLEEFFTTEVTFGARAKSDQVRDVHAIAAEIGGCIKNRFQTIKIDLKSPIVSLLWIEENNRIFVGVDLTNMMLSKREYRIFNNPYSLKGSVAAGLIFASGFAPGMTLFDPFSGSGTIAIEATLFSLQKSHLHFKKNDLACRLMPFFSGLDFDTLFASWEKPRKKQSRIIGFDIQTKNVEFSKKNAKIAGVVKDLQISRVEVDWMDLKIEDGCVDRIVTSPPQFSSSMDERRTLKSFQQLFHRAEILLAKKGVIALITNNGPKVKTVVPPWLTVFSERVVFQGQQMYDVLLLKRA